MTSADNKNILRVAFFPEYAAGSLDNPGSIETTPWPLVLKGSP
jgi:hypothetical protein